MKFNLLILSLLSSACFTNISSITRIIIKKPNPKTVIHLMNQSTIQVHNKKDFIIVSIPTKIISPIYSSIPTFKRIAKSRYNLSVDAEFIKGKLNVSITGNQVKIDYTNANFERHIKNILLSSNIYRLDRAYVNWNVKIAGNTHIQVVVPK